MGKHIVICTDGTWNDPTDQTNVYKLFGGLGTGTEETFEAAGGIGDFRRRRADGLVAYYIQGVGADGASNDPACGTFGTGLHKRLLDGYLLASQAYHAGDKFWLFGFSRGAWTARALGGLIAGAGLLDIHELHGKDPRHAANERWIAHKRHETATAAAKFWADHPQPIELVGVWDTVGALGIPFFNGVHAVEKLEKSLLDFADLALSPRVRHGRHALSIDERRGDFRPTLWDARENVSQLWFSGVHGDVGGGYPSAGLSDIALGWMLREAQMLGLPIRPEDIVPRIAMDKLQDRHDETQNPIWKLRPAAPRAIPSDAQFHPSVAERVSARPDYRPPVLASLPQFAARYTGQIPSERLQPRHEAPTFAPLQASKRVVVFSEKWWNSTGIEVKKGQRLRLSAAGAWRDKASVCSADGYPGDSIFLKTFQSMRRLREADWFSLIAAISSEVDLEARNSDASNIATESWQVLSRGVGDVDSASVLRRVGNAATLEIDRDGFLYLFANDVPQTYFNNSGSIIVDIENLNAAPAEAVAALLDGMAANA